MIEKVWEKPEIWKLSIELPENPLRNLNSYVICNEDRNLVIDTGFNRPECKKSLWNSLQKLDLDLSKTSLFVTHLHSDHLGLAQDFADYGCRIYMSSIDYDYLSNMIEGDAFPVIEERFHLEGFPRDELAKQVLGNHGRLYGIKSLFPAHRLQDGDKVYLGNLEMDFIHTPGHTPGHMMLYLPELQILFSGDHILFDITPNISIWNGVPHSLADYMESLNKVINLPVKMVFPAHRKEQTDLKFRITELINHHHERLAEIYYTVQEEPEIDAYSIASRIKWSARGKTWEEFPPHQKWFAVGETLAHLYYLADIGKMNRIKTKKGIVYSISKE